MALLPTGSQGDDVAPLRLDTLGRRLIFTWTRLLYACGGAVAQQRPVLVGTDAELGHSTSPSADATKRGATIAVDGINRASGVLGGFAFRLGWRRASHIAWLQ